MKLGNLMQVATKTYHRSLLVGKKYSPEILTAAGVVGVVTATVLACKATLKIEPVMDKVEEGLEVVKSRKEDGNVDYTEEDHVRDVAYIYTTATIDIFKLYAPAIIIGGASIACIIGSTRIARKRNIALVAAYKALESSYDEYRRRHTEEHGEDSDRDYRAGVYQEVVEEEDDNGKKVKKTRTTKDPSQYSQYARFFDETSINWEKTPEYNLLFLRQVQSYANDKLRSRGHLFLNEVYEMLGFEHSQAGSVVGWVISKDGDNFVDFGIYDYSSEKARDFVNGYERSILLDFNVDGVIYDKI